MARRNNKLGLRSKEDGDYPMEHPYDVDSLLELSNCLREEAGIDTKIKTETKERRKLIAEFLGDFDYLNKEQGINELSSLLTDTIVRTNSEHQATKLPANNATLLVFRFMDVLTQVVNNMNAKTQSKLFIGSSQSSPLDNATKFKLKELHQNLIRVMALAFTNAGESVSTFLAKFQGHKLWQNSLTQKQDIINSINSQSSVYRSLG